MTANVAEAGTDATADTTVDTTVGTIVGIVDRLTGGIVAVDDMLKSQGVPSGSDGECRHDGQTEDGWALPAMMDIKEMNGR